VSDFDGLELLPEVRRAFAEDLVDEGVIGLEDVDPEGPRGPKRFPRPSGEQLFRSFLERNAPIDAVAECARWLCFRDDRDANEGWNRPYVRGRGQELGSRAGRAGGNSSLSAAPRPLRGPAQSGPQRPLPLWQRQEIQEMLREELTLTPQL
jgi:hypothetical protein